MELPKHQSGSPDGGEKRRKPSNTKAISEGLEPPSPQPGMHVGKKVAMRAPDEGFFERMGDDAGFSAYIMKKLRRKTR